MIDTVIFDIGNVLMTFDYPSYLRRLFSEPDTVDRVEAAIWGSGLWNRLDLGDPPEVLFPLMEAADPAAAPLVRQALEGIAGCMAPRDYAVPWVRELKERGLRVLYLSNYSRFVMETMPEALAFLPWTDGGVFSCQEHLVKPDAAIYRVLLERWGLEPARCVFLDDTQANVDTARALGIKAIRFASYPQARAELDAMLEENANPWG